MTAKSSTTVRVRNVPVAAGKALDFVNRIERLRWIPRPVVRHLMKRYVNRHCEASHRQVLHSVGPGDIVVDLGANVGLFSTYFAQRGATVHSFEPDPSAYEVLEKHAREFDNIVLHQQAVYDHDGQMTLYRHKEFGKDQNYAQSSTLVAEKRNVDQAMAVTVPVVDVAAFMQTIKGRVRVMKIDVEGAEVAILNRLVDTGDLARIDHVLVETHEDIVPGLGLELDELKKRLAEKSYRQVDFSWY